MDAVLVIITISALVAAIGAAYLGVKHNLPIAVTLGAWLCATVVFAFAMLLIVFVIIPLVMIVVALALVLVVIGVLLVLSLWAWKSLKRSSRS